MAYKIRYFHIGHKSYMQFYISSPHIKKNRVLKCLLPVSRDYHNLINLFTKRNYTSLNEVHVSLKSFSELLHWRFPARPFHQVHNRLPFCPCTELKTPRTVCPGQGHTDRLAWNLASQRSSDSLELRPGSAERPGTSAFCRFLFILFLVFFHFPLIVITCTETSVSNILFKISLPGDVITNSMASKFCSFYRGPRLSYHDFESQAFTLHASSFKSPLDFFWKTQKKSFCFFWLQKDKHKKIPSMLFSYMPNNSSQVD